MNTELIISEFILTDIPLKERRSILFIGDRSGILMLLFYQNKELATIEILFQSSIG